MPAGDVGAGAGVGGGGSSSHPLAVLRPTRTASVSLEQLSGEEGELPIFATNQVSIKSGRQ